jgi:hypothetical protein
MPESGTSGSMSGDGKRSVAAWLKLPRPSSTLPRAKPAHVRLHVGYWVDCYKWNQSVAVDPVLPSRAQEFRTATWAVAHHEASHNGKTCSGRPRRKLSLLLQQIGMLSSA